MNNSNKWLVTRTIPKPIMTSAIQLLRQSCQHKLSYRRGRLDTISAELSAKRLLRSSCSALGERDMRSLGIVMGTKGSISAKDLTKDLLLYLRKCGLSSPHSSSKMIYKQSTGLQGKSKLKSPEQYLEPPFGNPWKRDMKDLYLAGSLTARKLTHLTKPKSIRFLLISSSREPDNLTPLISLLNCGDIESNPGPIIKDCVDPRYAINVDEKCIVKIVKCEDLDARARAWKNFYPKELESYDVEYYAHGDVKFINWGYVFSHILKCGKMVAWSCFLSDEFTRSFVSTLIHESLIHKTLRVIHNGVATQKYEKARWDAAMIKRYKDDWMGESLKQRFPGHYFAIQRNQRPDMKNRLIPPEVDMREYQHNPIFFVERRMERSMQGFVRTMTEIQRRASESKFDLFADLVKFTSEPLTSAHTSLRELIEFMNSSNYFTKQRIPANNTGNFIFSSVISLDENWHDAIQNLRAIYDQLLGVGERQLSTREKTQEILGVLAEITGSEPLKAVNDAGGISEGSWKSIYVLLMDLFQVSVKMVDTLGEKEVVQLFCDQVMKKFQEMIPIVSGSEGDRRKGCLEIQRYLMWISNNYIPQARDPGASFVRSVARIGAARLSEPASVSDNAIWSEILVRLKGAIGADACYRANELEAINVNMEKTFQEICDEAEIKIPSLRVFPEEVSKMPDYYLIERDARELTLYEFGWQTSDVVKAQSDRDKWSFIAAHVEEKVAWRLNIIVQILGPDMKSWPRSLRDRKEIMDPAGKLRKCFAIANKFTSPESKNVVFSSIGTQAIRKKHTYFKSAFPAPNEEKLRSVRTWLVSNDETYGPEYSDLVNIEGDFADELRTEWDDEDNKMLNSLADQVAEHSEDWTGLVDVDGASGKELVDAWDAEDNKYGWDYNPDFDRFTALPSFTRLEEDETYTAFSTSKSQLSFKTETVQGTAKERRLARSLSKIAHLLAGLPFFREATGHTKVWVGLCKDDAEDKDVFKVLKQAVDEFQGASRTKEEKEKMGQSELSKLVKDHNKFSEKFDLYSRLTIHFEKNGIMESLEACSGKTLKQISEVIMDRIRESPMRASMLAIVNEMIPSAIQTKAEKVEVAEEEAEAKKTSKANTSNFKPSEAEKSIFADYIAWLQDSSSSSISASERARQILYTEELYNLLRKENAGTIYEAGLNMHDDLLQILEGTNAFAMGLLMCEVADVTKTYMSNKKRFGLSMFKLHRFPAVLIVNSRKTRRFSGNGSSNISARLLLLEGSWGAKNSTRGKQFSSWHEKLSNPFIINNRIMVGFMIALRSAILSTSLWAQNKGISITTESGKNELKKWFAWTIFYCLDGTRTSQKISGNFRYIMVAGQDGCYLNAKEMGKKMATVIRRTSHYVMVENMKASARHMFTTNATRVAETEKFWDGQPCVSFHPIHDYLTGLDITTYPCMHLVMYRYHHTSKIIPDMDRSKKMIGLKSLEGHFKCMDQYENEGDDADAIRGIPTGESDWDSLHSHILNKGNTMGGSRKICAMASRWTIKQRGKGAYNNWKNQVNMNKGLSDLMNNTSIVEKTRPRVDIEKAQKALREEKDTKFIKRCIKAEGRLPEDLVQARLDDLYERGILKSEESRDKYKGLWSSMHKKQEVDEVLRQFVTGDLQGSTRNESLLNLSITIKHLAKDFKTFIKAREKTLIRQKIKMKPECKNKRIFRNPVYYWKARGILDKHDHEMMIMEYLQSKDLLKLDGPITSKHDTFTEIQEALNAYSATSFNADDPENVTKHLKFIEKLKDVKHIMRATQNDRKFTLMAIAFFLGTKNADEKNLLKDLMNTYKVEVEVLTDNMDQCIKPTREFFRTLSKMFREYEICDFGHLTMMTSFRLVFTELLTRSMVHELIESALKVASTSSITELARQLDVLYLYLPPEQHCFYMLNACLTCHERTTSDIQRIARKGDHEVTLSYAQKTKVSFLIASLVTQCLKSGDKASSNVIRMADSEVYKHNCAKVSLASKAQHQDVRELGILHYETKIQCYAAERIAEPLVRANGNDVVTAPHSKYKFVADSVKQDDAPVYDDDGRVKSFCVLASKDMSKWGPYHIPHLFTASMRPYYSLIGNAWYLVDIPLLKMSQKQVEIVTQIITIVLRDDYRTGENLIMDRIREYVLRTGNLYMVKENDMIQGILHVISSMVHSTGLIFSHEVIRRAFEKRQIKVTGSGSTGSDDSAVKVRIEFLDPKLPAEAKTIGRQVMEAYTRVARLFNMTESPKSVYCWKTMELNSLTNNCSRFYMPDIRNITQQFAPMPLNSHSAIQTKFVSMAQQGISSSGLPISVIQQFWLLFQGMWLQIIGMCPGPAYPFQPDMPFKLPLEFGLVRPHLSEIVDKSPLMVDMERIVEIYRHPNRTKWDGIRNLLSHCKVNLRSVPGVRNPIDPCLLTVPFKRIIPATTCVQAEALKTMRESLKTRSLGYVQEQLLSLCVPNSVEADALRLYRMLDSPDALKEMNLAEKMRCVADLGHQYHGHFVWKPESIKLPHGVTSLTRGPTKVLIKHSDFIQLAMRSEAPGVLEELLGIAERISMQNSPMSAAIRQLETAQVTSYSSNIINSYGMFDVNLSEGRRTMENDPFHLMLLTIDEDCYTRNVAGVLDFGALKSDVEILKGLIGPQLEKLNDLAEKEKNEALEESEKRYIKNIMELLMLIRAECGVKKMKILGPLYPKITNINFFRFYATDNNIRGVKLYLGTSLETYESSGVIDSVYEEIKGAVSTIACLCSNTSEIQQACQRMRGVRRTISDAVYTVDSVLNTVAGKILTRRKQKELLLLKALFGDTQAMTRLASDSHLKFRKIKLSTTEYLVQIDKTVAKIDTLETAVYCNTDIADKQMDAIIILMDWLFAEKVYSQSTNFMYDAIPKELITGGMFTTKLYYDGADLKIGRTVNPGLQIKFDKDIVPDRTAILRYIEPVSFLECSPGSLNLCVCVRLESDAAEVDSAQSASIAMSGASRTAVIKKLPDTLLKKSISGMALPQRAPYSSMRWLEDITREYKPQHDRFTADSIPKIRTTEMALSLEWDPKLTTMLKQADARLKPIASEFKREILSKEFSGLIHILDTDEGSDDLSIQISDVLNKMEGQTMPPFSRLEEDIHSYAVAGSNTKMSVSTLAFFSSVPFYMDLIESYMTIMQQHKGHFWLEVLKPIYSDPQNTFAPRGGKAEKHGPYITRGCTDRKLNAAVSMLYMLSRVTAPPQWVGYKFGESFKFMVRYDYDSGGLVANMKWNTSDEDSSPELAELLDSLRVRHLVNEQTLLTDITRTYTMKVQNLRSLLTLLRDPG